jgi:hypothetical protein
MFMTFYSYLPFMIRKINLRRNVTLDTVELNDFLLQINILYMNCLIISVINQQRYIFFQVIDSILETIVLSYEVVLFSSGLGDTIFINIKN